MPFARERVALAALAALAACTPTDPDLDKPCGDRRAPSVIVGTGADDYQAIGPAGVLIETDGQGDASIWLGVACRGLGPDVNLSYGIKATGTDVTGTLSQGVSLSYDPSSDRDEAGGLAGTFNLDPMGKIPSAQDLVGKQVTLWADATDTCHVAPIHGETQALVAGFDVATCTGCLEQACGAENDACGAECRAIQACLDTVCANLSATGSSDEVACQVHCQGLHPDGRKAHLALVDCVQLSICQPPCLGYSYDYDQCVDAENTSACQGALAACTNSGDCQAYKACAGACTSLDGCLACAGGARGAAGEALFEGYELCVEDACLAPGWLLHM